MSTLKTTQPKPKPDPALYADFLSALRRVTEHGETVTVHGVTICWPKRQPSYYALRINAPRTVRDPWTGALSYIVGQSGGDALRPKRVATMLAFQMAADRTLRARLLAEAKPGILGGAVTYEAV